MGIITDVNHIKHVNHINSDIIDIYCIISKLYINI